jgi:hypothetical protein
VGEVGVKLREIADRIADHLDRLEQDEEANHVMWTPSGKTEPEKLTLIWRPSVWVGGAYICVRFISYQSHQVLTRDGALKYLAYLDGGGKERLGASLKQELGIK